MVETDHPNALFEERLQPNLVAHHRLEAILGLVWAALGEEAGFGGNL